MESGIALLAIGSNSKNQEINRNYITKVSLEMALECCIS